MSLIAFDKEEMRRAMKANSVSHEALAKAVGLTHKSAVGKILSGGRAVKANEALAIYTYLGISTPSDNAVRSVPIIGLAAAGNWREAIEMPIGRTVVPNRVAGPKAFAVEVIGDSMNQLIDDGGWIVIDPEDKSLWDGKSYLIQNEAHEVTVKRYRTKPARFEPVSDNQEHAAFLVSDVDFVVIGRVVWKGEAV